MLGALHPASAFVVLLSVCRHPIILSNAQMLERPLPGTITGGWKETLSRHCKGLPSLWAQLAAFRVPSLSQGQIRVISIVSLRH